MKYNPGNKIVTGVFCLLINISLLNAQQLSYATRALGNDHLGHPGPHVQNHITHMKVMPDGKCYTWSIWDEGGNSKSIYQNGQMIDRHNDDNISSYNTTDLKGNIWTIEKPFRRFLAQKVNPGGIGYDKDDYDTYIKPVPTGFNAPYIKCSDGRIITDVVDPSAIGINYNTGELLVAENGPDQNVRIYNISGKPKLVGTFGRRGGVWGKNNPGLMDNPLKFAGITGVGADSEGTIYVANSVVNAQECAGGCSDLRAFNPDGSLRWRAKGLLFVNSAVVDPNSDGTIIYTSYYKFKMDYSKPAGQDWEVIATSINPFDYPDDPRLLHSTEEAFDIRYINENKYLYLSDMYTNAFFIYRFDGEIAVPCAVFTAAYGWNGDEYNRLIWHWNRNRPPGPRWMWVDRNGDATATSDEFETFDIGRFVEAIDVDKEGNIYMGNGGNQSGVWKFPANHYDSHGNPQYSASSITKIVDVGHSVATMKWLEDTDLFICGNNWKISEIDIWENWSKPSRKSVRKIKTITGDNLHPESITADNEYVYLSYMGVTGPNGTSGEIAVYRIADGVFMGYILPGPEVESHSGWLDMNQPTKVFVRPNGERIITVEEDHAGKILIYSWHPPDN